MPFRDNSPNFFTTTRRENVPVTTVTSSGGIVTSDLTSGAIVASEPKPGTGAVRHKGRGEKAHTRYIAARSIEAADEA
jgi:hypothetical protein